MDVKPYPTTITGEASSPPGRWQWLLKWLLAFPHYIITSVFSQILGILMLAVGIILLFTGKYPEDLFKFIVGMNRWIFRASIYISLMRDEYPSFSLD